MGIYDEREPKAENTITFEEISILMGGYDLLVDALDDKLRCTPGLPLNQIVDKICAEYIDTRN